jgi:predicted DCC family thiol-disulfide oxidoreductase YuxK
MAEIGHYKKQAGASRLCFRDISDADQTIEPDLSKTRAMARFHVRRSNGELVSGAAAFVSIWLLLPRWRWAARIAGLPGVISLLEFGYRLFLPARPTLSHAVKAMKTWRRD